MNCIEQKNNTNCDNSSDFFENISYQKEPLRISEPELPPNEAIDSDSTEGHAVLEIKANTDNDFVQEILMEGAEHSDYVVTSARNEPIKHEYMVFAADGTLLSHDVGEHTPEANLPPILMDDGTIYEEIAEEVEPPISTDEKLSDNSEALMMNARSASLNVNVSGWNNIPGNGWQSGAVNVTSNIGWTLSRNVTWLTPSIALGNWFGSGGFLVTVAANPTTSPRTGTISISGGGITRNVTFAQLGAVQPNLTVSTGGWTNIPGSGWTSGTITVTSNIVWTLSRSATWLTPSIALGNWYRSGSFNVRVAQNTTLTTRTGMVTVSGGGLTRHVSFTQLGGATANLTVTPPGWNNITPNGVTVGSINVTSNIVWNLARSVTWLTPSIALGNWYRSGGFNVTVAQNTATTARTGLITISGSGITRNVSFTQLGNTNLTVSTSGWSNISANGFTTGNINVTSTSTWNLTRNANWVTPSIGLGNHTGNRSFTVRIDANPHSLTRDATISVSSGGTTRNIVFIQHGSTNLTVSSTGWRDISASGWTSGNINVTSNITWNLTRSANWVTPSIGLGNWFGNRSFTVNVGANSHTLPRDATVTVSGNGLTRNISFFQQGAASFISPYRNRVRITSPHAYRQRPGGNPELHAGIDLAAGSGTRIYAISDGIVIANRNGSPGLGSGFGNHIIIQHHHPSLGNFCALYAHLRDRSSLVEGRSINRGELIGLEGGTQGPGLPLLGSHLHFQTWRGTAIDYNPHNAFNPLDLYGIAMTRTGIDNSALFSIDTVSGAYSWNWNFLSNHPRGSTFVHQGQALNNQTRMAELISFLRSIDSTRVNRYLSQ